MHSACVLLYWHLWPARLFRIFPPYSTKKTRFSGKKKFTEQKCVLWFSLQILPEIIFILRTIHRDIIMNIHRSSFEIPVILVRFRWISNFLASLKKNNKIPNIMKICPVEPSCSLRMDRERDGRGARGGAFGWGTALQAGRSRVRFPMVSLQFLIDLITSDRTMALGSTHPVREVSSRNIFWDVKTAGA